MHFRGCGGLFGSGFSHPILGGNSFNQLNFYFMAKIPFGILGAFIGKVGPVIGKTWKGKAIVTSKRGPSKRDEDPTPEQAKLRTKFGFTSKFLKGSGPLVKKTFHEGAIGVTEFHCAVSYNVCNAVSKTDAGFKLHYELVSIGRGTLPNAVLPEAKAEDGGNIRFIWADNTGVGTAAATDAAIAVLYHPASGRWLYEKAPDAKRSDCSVVFNLSGLKGHTVHTWLTFVSENKKAADSVYTGELVVR
jgi:hypothetical protein